MKARILFAFLIIKLIPSALAQEQIPKISHISMGETFLSFEMQSTNKYKIKDSFYQTRCLKFGGGYYFIKRVAVKATITGQHYQAQEIVTPTNKEFNKKNLVLLSGHLRYNFWEAKGLVATFLQTGYAYGQFINLEKTHVNRLEILTLGGTFYIPFDNSSKLSFDVAVGMEKDNLNQKIAYPMFLGFNYYLRKPGT